MLVPDICLVIAIILCAMAGFNARRDPGLSGQTGWYGVFFMGLWLLLSAVIPFSRARFL